MSLDKTIAINERLLDREALFMRVHELESRMDEILGMPYPLDVPVELPSIKKRRKPAKKKMKAKAKRLRIRGLEPGETTYRIEYHCNEKDFVENHYDALSVERFINGPLAGVRIMAVEILYEDGEISEQILRDQ